MTKRVALYIRVSTSDGQTTENQLQHVVDRLNDHAAHRQNRWAESLRMDVRAIPA